MGSSPIITLRIKAFIMKNWIITSLFSLAMLITSNAQAQLEVGNKAPDFTLKDQKNQSVQLSKLQGQWIVLYFYPKNDTPGCTTEACSFRDNINKLIDQQATILGVSVDSIESHQAFTQKYQLPFQLLADTEGEIADKYDALLNLGIMKFAKRHSFIIDPQGRINKIYRSVDPDKHVLEVLDDLKNAQANWKTS